MCCCDKPNVNGQPGYKWQPEHKPGIRPVAPPTLDDGDALIFDEPGRCGGIDSHSHHYRVVKRRFLGYWLYAHSGCGDKRIRLHGPDEGPRTTGSVVSTLLSLDSNARYWLLNAIYHATFDAEQDARDEESRKWRMAAAEKRIKTRKVRGSDAVKVWLEPARAIAAAEGR